MRILIVGGAGLMSAGTARDLLSNLSSGVTKIIAADASVERLDALKKSLADPRLETRVFDVSDRAALVSLLRDCDLCINGVPTFAGFQMAIFEACLEAKRPYVDYGGMGVYTVRQKAQHAKWKDAAATAVLGLGSDPGLSNIICRAVADRLDRIDRINLYWAATKIGPESPVLVPPYSISTVLAEYANPSQQFLDGKLQEVPAQAGVEVIDLPQPWGRTTFIHSQHSEPLTVPFSEGIAEKGIREFTWKLSLPARDHEAWVGLVKAGFGATDEPVTVKGVSVRPLDVLQAVIDRNISKNRSRIPVQETHEIHFAIGQGTRDGKRCRVTCRVIGHPDPLYDDYADAGTSMNMSIGVQQILSRPLRPGVWAAEEYFQADAFFAELRKRHFSIEIETQTLESA
ncbi:MAG TPA: saccharopine dehydrogenase NADP-binding domain-containing protein [Terriglobales bacterium]|nr:saccharopine dehydrogenase NADP-binding domain-containing protein [Terriglobales bacterium]